MRLLLSSAIAALLFAIAAYAGIFFFDQGGSFPAPAQLAAIVLMYISASTAAILFLTTVSLMIYRKLKPPVAGGSQ